MTEKCSKCRYYQFLDEYQGRNTGKCMRYPPQSLRYNFSWPIVDGDYDWCGEFEDKAQGSGDLRDPAKYYRQHFW